jgi:hypothetical protein
MPGPKPPEDLYAENLRFIQHHHPHLFQLLQSVPLAGSKTETAKNGSLTLVYHHNQTPFYLHSRFNPEAESLKLVKKKDFHADHIVVFGLGLGYHLQQVMELKDPLARVFLVEPEVEIFHQSLKCTDWKRLLNRKDFFYVLGPDTGAISDIIHQFINIAGFDKLEFIELPSETRLLNVFFGKAKEAIEAEVKSNLYDFKTRLAESYMVPRNVLKNLPLVLKTKPITVLKDAFKGTPGVIVSAGPSLDRNILELKKIRDRAVIVAVDTALKPLLARSIRPHFTAAGDPSHKNYLHLQGTEHIPRHFIVAEPGISHQVYRDFKDRIFSLSVGKAIVRMLENHSEPLGEVQAWGSVISIALDFAVYMGLNPIIFVGQDFAFSGTRNHCRGTSWEEKIIEYSRGLDELQRFETQSIAGNRKVLETLDIYGHKIYSSERLMLYKNFLAKLVSGYPHVRFINATEGGIFSDIPNMTLYDAMRRYIFPVGPVDFTRLQEFSTMDKEENVQRLTGFLDEKHRFFKDYRDKLKETLKLLSKSKQADPAALTAMFRQAEEVHGLPYAPGEKGTENGELLEMWSAAPIYHFMKEYKSIRNQALNQATIKEGLEIYKKYFRGITPLVKDIVKQLEKTSVRLRPLNRSSP